MAQLTANRYANALFELALETNKIDLFNDEIKTVSEVLKSDSKFMDVLNHPQINSEEKMSIFTNAFKGKISNEILGLFNVVLTKNREDELINILEVFMEKVENYKGIVKAEVISAVKLTSDQIDRIKQNLSKNLNKQVIIDTCVDCSLIGGMIIKVDGHVIDGSIKSKLDNLTNNLHKIQLAQSKGV